MNNTLVDISGELDADVVYAFSSISKAAAIEAIDFLGKAYSGYPTVASARQLRGVPKEIAIRPYDNQY
jgi:hypothetical protein